MIGRLLGHVVTETPEGPLIIDVNGVGYEVLAPLGTTGRAARDAEGRITLFIHTSFRQESLDLFAFASEHERRVFRLLVAVPNVGPKTAVALLGAIPPRELAVVVRTGDLARLGRVPGIGKKIAERLLLELKTKVADLQGPGEVPPIEVGPAPDKVSRVLQALTSMGYKTAEAQAAVRSLGGAIGERAVPELIREALAWLGR